MNYKHCNREHTLETCGLRWLIELKCLCSQNPPTWPGTYWHWTYRAECRRMTRNWRFSTTHKALFTWHWVNGETKEVSTLALTSIGQGPGRPGPLKNRFPSQPWKKPEFEKVICLRGSALPVRRPSSAFLSAQLPTEPEAALPAGEKPQVEQTPHKC